MANQEDENNRNRRWVSGLENHLTILILITSLVTLYVLSVQIRIGVPYWDVFNYLNNALYFAGMGRGSVLYLPPLVPILTSLFFRMGYVSANVIFIIHAIFFILGVIGLYFVLRFRFDPKESLAGGLIFISLPVVFPWIASGGIDIPAISLSIWAVYFTVIGVRRKSRLLYLAVPTLALAALARYTAILMILPIILYIIINDERVQNSKKILLSILLTCIVFTPLLIYFLIRLGNISIILNLILSTLFGSASAADDVAYNPNMFFYLQNILNYMSLSQVLGPYDQVMNPSRAQAGVLAYLISIMAGSGILIYFSRILKEHMAKYAKIASSSDRKQFILKLAFLVIMIAMFFLSLNNLPYVVSEAFLFLAIITAYFGLIKSGKRNLELDIFFFYWFAVYLVFHSALSMKVDRYFITMAPALTYFILLGLLELIPFLNSKFNLKSRVKNSWPLSAGSVCVIIALVFLAFSTATFAGHTPKKIFEKDVGLAADWIMEYDQNYQDEVIFSDYSAAASWYFKKDVKGAFPRFYSDIWVFSDHLNRWNASYYIDSLSQPKPEIPGYTPIKSFGKVTIYQKNNS